MALAPNGTSAVQHEVFAQGWLDGDGYSWGALPMLAAPPSHLHARPRWGVWLSPCSLNVHFPVCRAASGCGTGAGQLAAGVG